MRQVSFSTRILFAAVEFGRLVSIHDGLDQHLATARQFEGAEMSDDPTRHPPHILYILNVAPVLPLTKFREVYEIRAAR